VNFRRMKLEDVVEVHALDVASFSLPWPERSFRYELTENPASRMWVAENTERQQGQRIRAMLGLWLIVDEAHIGTIAVVAEEHRKGLGQQLLAHALLEASNEGARSVYLEVRAGNTAAQRMYHKFGFEIAAVRPRYYSDNYEDALLMNWESIDREKLERLLKEVKVQAGG
jgi:[ribosomal protein S18]-alanine N-acetyltransferase